MKSAPLGRTAMQLDRHSKYLFLYYTICLIKLLCMYHHHSSHCYFSRTSIHKRLVGGREGVGPRGEWRGATEGDLYNIGEYVARDHLYVQYRTLQLNGERIWLRYITYTALLHVQNLRAWISEGNRKAMHKIPRATISFSCMQKIS